MLSKEELIVLRHYAKGGQTKTAIAKNLGINRRTVHRNLSNGKDEPEYGPRPRRPSKLDHYKVYLMGRIETYPELSAQSPISALIPLSSRDAYSIVCVAVYETWADLWSSRHGYYPP